MSGFFFTRDGAHFFFQPWRICILEGFEVGALAARTFQRVTAHDLAAVSAQNDVHKCLRLVRKMPEDGSEDTD